ncbi:hypothetical protein OC845_005512 [Tilletia horrida]|nr:hypothetical protein OC845_005512 [Tilletia horrida]
MASYCKKPFLFISTAFLFAGVHVATAGVIPTSPQTPPESPTMSTEVATFGGPAPAFADPATMPARSVASEHWSAPKPKRLDQIAHLHYSSPSPAQSDAHQADVQTRPDAVSASQERALNGFGAPQSGGTRPKNEIRASRGSLGGGPDRGNEAPAHLQDREVALEHIGAGSMGKQERNTGNPSFSDGEPVSSDSRRSQNEERNTGNASFSDGEPESSDSRRSQSEERNTGNPSFSDGEPVSSDYRRGESEAQSNKSLVKRQRYTGKGTYYRVGMGACGWHNNSEQMVAAIDQGQYHGGSHCGNTARVCHAGNCVTVKIVDECPGCGWGSLDLSPAAFRALAPLKIGVIDIAWSFN